VVNRIRSDVRNQALSQAEVVASSANDAVVPPQLAKLDELAKTNAESVKGRVMIVNTRGLVIADSAGPGRTGADYSTRPEIALAVHGIPKQTERYSKTLKRNILATAVPILHFGKTVGAVRTTQATSAVDDSVNRAVMVLIAIGLLVLALGLLAGWLIADQLARPMRRLEETAQLVYAGDLDARAEIEGPREQRTLAASFNNMIDRLTQMLQGQRDFVADASHELRTPIASLRLQLEEIVYITKSDEVQDQAARATAAVNRINSTIDELLYLSRLAERTSAAERIDLDEYLVGLAERWQVNAAAAGLTVDLRPPSGRGDHFCLCATHDLDRVLDALIENSVAYAASGGVIEVGAVDGGVDILDRGPGLEEGEEDQVFGRFKRGSAGRGRREGTGLGLAIARELIETWNGTVTLENRADGTQGARASVRVPDGVLPEEVLSDEPTLEGTVD